jgi:hypothetical protein
MTPTLKQVVQRLGKTGIAFLVSFLFFFLFYFIGKGGLALLFAVIALPLACIVAFRVLRYVHHRGLWSVRNRLLFLYGLIGVLPLLLVLVLIGLGAWAVTTELAIYLASSELTRRIGTIQSTVDSIRQLPRDQRVEAAPEVVKYFEASLPGLRLYINDATGSHRFPRDVPELHLPPGWHNVNGLVVQDGRFFEWAHYAGEGEEICALAPLSDDMVENMVTNLGAI